MTTSTDQSATKTAPFAHQTKRLFVTIIVLVLVFLAGSWLVWFETRPVYDAKQWASITFTLPEFILYHLDATPSNAVHVLRDGLMNELARSGKLPLGYPKLITTSWKDNFPCNDKDIALGARYLLQLTETPENYIELPLCPRSNMGSDITIYLLPPWPWAKVDDTTPTIFIGLEKFREYELKSGQYALIFDALKNMGLKLYMDEFFQSLLKK